MNGIGGGGGSGGGGQYGSEDDYDDYKPPAAHASSYYTSGLSSSSSLATHGGGGSQGLNYSGGGGPSSRNQICCLVDDNKRCSRFAGNASYSKRIQKTVYYKRLKLEIDLSANHIYICDYHKMVIQNARSRKKDSDDENIETDEVPDVDLFQLQVNTLRRYKKHFKIQSRPGLNKAQLAELLSRHFKTIPVTEKETVTYFIYMIKAEKNRLDYPNRSNEAAGNAGGSEYSDRY